MTCPRFPLHALRPCAARPPAVASILMLAWTSACSSAAVGPSPDRLFGEWRWLRSVGGIAGEVRTPESEGFTRTVRFLQPDRVEFLQDGTLEAATRFDLRPGRDDVDPPDVVRIVYRDPVPGGFQEQYVSFAEPDGLVLTDLCCDGFESTYVREDG